LKNVRVVVTLGGLAFRTYLTILRDRGTIASLSKFEFGHNRVYQTVPALIGSYHPSQQNTSTGKLTATMLREVFEHARRLAD
jgi:uracil-DNA glycosylase